MRGKRNKQIYEAWPEGRRREWRPRMELEPDIEEIARVRGMELKHSRKWHRIETSKRKWINGLILKCNGERWRRRSYWNIKNINNVEHLSPSHTHTHTHTRAHTLTFTQSTSTADESHHRALFAPALSTDVSLFPSF